VSPFRSTQDPRSRTPGGGLTSWRRGSRGTSRNSHDRN
jgi:hypothetical protein